MTRWPLSIAFLSAFSASAVASPVFESAEQTPWYLPPLLVAQSGAEGLSDSDLQRINFYANRGLQSIRDLGDSPSEAAQQSLRDRVLRLIDAGQRSGLNQQQTADFFQAYVQEQGLITFPTSLLNEAGQFDSEALFGSVIAFSQQAPSVGVNVEAILQADLNALQAAAGGEVTLITPEPDEILEPVFVPLPATIEGPVVPANANADARAIFERIVVSGDQWIIEVIQGDSLSEFADALYGDRGQFRRIFEANRNVLNTPNVLEIGYILVLPRDE